MKMIVQVELITDWGDINTVEVARIDRPVQTLEPETVGLLLEDGKRLLHDLQQIVVHAQTNEYCSLRRMCQHCHRWTEVKDSSV